MAPDPSERINPHHTVESFEEKIEGMDFIPWDPDKDHFLCDMCSKGVNYAANPRFAMYFTDKILNEEHPQKEKIMRERPLTPMASYCPDCSRKRLLLPCEGFGELRVFINVGPERVMRNVEVTDISPEDDGIPWNPRELTEKITESEFGTNAVMAALHLGGEQLWGPENIVTSFLASVETVDLRDVVRWDGSLDPKALGRARREYSQFMKNMRGSGYDRQRFTEEVRDDRQ